MVKNSNWTAHNGVYKLITCPTGYSKVSPENEWDQHKCEPCLDGTECVLEVCDTCTDCLPGKYKDTPGTQACRDCPGNTYSNKTGSKDSASCQACPLGADTGNPPLTGQTDASACQCGDRFYLAGGSADQILSLIHI